MEEGDEARRWVGHLPIKGEREQIAGIHIGQHVAMPIDRDTEP